MTHYPHLMTRNKLQFVFLLLLTPFIGLSQEVLFDLGANPIIREAYINNQSSRSGSEQASYRAPGDTLQLPFFEDFAKPVIFPDNTFWLDSFAFVNANYAKYPPSIGMATLEGLNKDGMPYEFTFNQPQGKADELTSRWIDLSGYTAADSLYFSFYYQPQGLGNAPETEDSLVLQFKYTYLDTNNAPQYDWTSVWKMNGSNTQSDSLFTQVILPVTDTFYFYNGFQFRFVNYATLSGNVDHWHIDYIYLNENRNHADTAYFDGAFTRPLYSVLRDYQAMPWQHFIEDSTDLTGDTFHFSIHNFWNDLMNISFIGDIIDQNSSVLVNLTQGTPVNAEPYVYCGNHDYDDCGELQFRDSLLGFNYPTNFPGTKVDFKIRGNLAVTGADTRTDNNSVEYTQQFHNFYAYDDGSAENAYGLLQVGGIIAYQFTLNKPDTLRAVQIYFNPVLDDVSEKKFKLVAWAGDANGPIGDPVYLSDSLYSPTYFPGFYNGYYTYVLDRAVYLADTVYIGWVQEEGELLNIGLDRNLNANKHMFFSLNNGQSWITSNLKGAWMMRPVFGDPVSNPVGIEKITETPTFRLFPNPTEDILNITNSLNDNLSNYRLKVFDNTGRLILAEENAPSQLHLGELKPGFYMVHIASKSGTYSHTHKIVVK